MKRQNKYSILGLRALQRAAAKVHEDARKNNYKIPIWKNGKIVYEIPNVIADSRADHQADSPDVPSPEL